MHRIRMDERDLETEEPAVWLLVDHVHALLLEVGELAPKVGHRVRDVMHSRPPLREELADRRVVREWRDQLDPALTNAYRRRLDPLGLHQVATLDLGAQKLAERVDRLVEVLDRDPQVMDPLRLHSE